jgi:uncharacterized protein (DUF4415 family)
MTDDDIDYSDIPEVTPEQFARGIVRWGWEPSPPKSQLTLRLDQDVVDWFRAHGRGYQTRINFILRAYMQEHQRLNA